MSHESSLISRPARQRGFSLLEALIGLMIFSLGILGLLGMQAVAIKGNADAKYRADAAFLANQIIGQMWADNPAQRAAYAHRADGALCANDGTVSANANVTAWVTAVGGTLPGTANARPSIAIATNRVTVTVCWQGPQETAPHSHQAVAEIAG